MGNTEGVHPPPSTPDGAIPVDRPDDSPRPTSSAESHPEPEEIPLGQRLFERPFLLLILGILIMAVFYTGWGMYEIMSMETAPLP
jgi:hypothetical protein